MIKKTLFIGGLLVFSQACAFAQTPDDLAREYYKKGNIYYQQGMYTQAQDEYNKAMDVLKGRDVNVQPAETSPAHVSGDKVSVPAGGEQSLVQVSGSAEYVIGDDDVLYIAVWQNEDLTQEAIVRPDGKISVPLIGDVMARGLTITMLDDDLTKRLSEYVRSPEVSISLRKLGGSKVIMLGEISKPGVYSMQGQKTILEAIGLAGGFTRDAVASSIVLIRGGLLSPRAERINLSRALKGKDFIRQNIVLQAEDVIFVPKKFIANLNYFLSQIVDPLSKGAYIKEQYKTNW
ncbi:MAG: polysaccharide biosynthesis/export family protein [Candidatus Omnitrophota bacterium]